MGGGEFLLPLYYRRYKWQMFSQKLIGVTGLANLLKKLLKKKKAEMLEEQIRDSVPCDVETKEEKDEKL